MERMPQRKTCFSVPASSPCLQRLSYARLDEDMLEELISFTHHYSF